jgi:hypothetical protein
MDVKEMGCCDEYRLVNLPVLPLVNSCDAYVFSCKPSTKYIVLFPVSF